MLLLIGFFFSYIFAFLLWDLIEMFVVKHALSRCTKNIKTLAPGKREKEKTMNWNQKGPFPLMKGICYVVGAWLYDQPKVIQSHQKNSRSHTEKFLLPWMLKVQVYSEVAIAIGVKRYSSYGHLKPLANVRSCRKSGRSYSVFVIVIVIVIVIVRGWAKSSQEHLEWSALSQETMICMYWSFLLSLILLLSSGWRGTPQIWALEASS